MLCSILQVRDMQAPRPEMCGSACMSAYMPRRVGMVLCQGAEGVALSAYMRRGSSRLCRRSASTFYAPAIPHAYHIPPVLLHAYIHKDAPSSYASVHEDQDAPSLYAPVHEASHALANAHTAANAHAIARIFTRTRHAALLSPPSLIDCITASVRTEVGEWVRTHARPEAGVRTNT